MGPEWRSKVKVPIWLRGIFCLLLGGLFTAAPFIYYRYTYTHGKRLRVVEPGLFYRSGCMTAPGFREAIQRYGIRTILNVNDEEPDTPLAEGYFSKESILESELCKEMNVKYVFLCLDLLDKRKSNLARPAAIEQFLALMDNPENYPVLIHCRAGLHRTGCLVAVYRMEYDHWSMEQALGELKAHGFGEYASTDFNEYIAQYVVNYQPGIRNPVAGQKSEVRGQRTEVRGQRSGNIQRVGPRINNVVFRPFMDSMIIPTKYLHPSDVSDP
jgi:hypothetical protein